MKTKPRQLKAKVKEIRKIKKDVFILSFTSVYLSQGARPGNFLHLRISSVILRRPFSIHKISGNTIYILFRIRGRGTRALARYKKGKALDIIGPLGNGFKLNSGPSVLVAGGLGVAPLVFLAQKLGKGEKLVLLGAKNKNEILGEKEFKKLNCKIEVATEDGSQGLKGNVVNLLKTILRTTNDERRTTIYACGPKEMFLEIKKAVKKTHKLNCQVSFEQFMGCGLGICCACVIKTKKGYKKVCKDGPVFNIKDIC
jgi:dihydroorotate dehydrogenase electron transfer subunit